MTSGTLGEALRNLVQEALPWLDSLTPHFARHTVQERGALMSVPLPL